jgi:hypothetical protein
MTTATTFLAHPFEVFKVLGAVLVDIGLASFQRVAELLHVSQF